MEALREDYIQLIKDEYKEKKELKKMEDALNDSKEKLRQKQEELNKLTYNGALQVVEMTPDEATAYASVTREIEQLNKEVEANQDKVNEAKGTVQQVTDDMQFCCNELKIPLLELRKIRSRLSQMRMNKLKTKCNQNLVLLILTQAVLFQSLET